MIATKILKLFFVCIKKILKEERSYRGEIMEFFKDILDTESFKFEINKKLSKNEYKLLVYLLEELSKEEEKESLTIDKSIIVEKLNFYNENEFNEEIEKLYQKYIKYEYQKQNRDIEKGIFSLIGSLNFLENKVIVKFSTEIINSFKSDNLFYKENLLVLLKFKNGLTYKLYRFINNSYSNMKSIEVPIEKLREVFDAKESYERLYDFEKNVLEAIVRDINNYSNYFVTYEKIRGNQGKSNKIVSILFNFYDKTQEEIQKNTNKLFELVRSYVKDFDFVISLLKESLVKNKYDYVKKNIFFTIQHFDRDFDNFLGEALKENYVETYFEKKLKVEETNYKLEVCIDKHYSSIFKLESELYRELSSLKFYYDSEFAKKLHEFMKKNEIDYSDDRIKIFVEYNKASDSKIRIYRAIEKS